MILADLPLETLLATGYAVLLLVIAAGLEMMGRHSHRRAGQYHNRGFRFHKHADHWECPQGARLERAEIDNELRVIRYRAPAQTCKGCPIRGQCTDSDSGRELSVSLDPWLSSEIGRFHRGISLALLILAVLIMAVELVRHGRGPERWVLSAALATLSLLALNVARGLRGDTQR
jgi:hypothetical protein